MTQGGEELKTELRALSLTGTTFARYYNGLFSVCFDELGVRPSSEKVNMRR
jgi:hypothetical protein